MAPFEDKPLFSLIPLTFSAQKIVHANSEYAKSFNGKPCLSFKAGHKSRLPGKLVSFGSCVGINDILLPYTAFLELHCCFSLDWSGELILEDLTAGHHTTLEWYSSHGREERHSLKGDPRQRAIPRAEAKEIRISLDKITTFMFQWNRHMDQEVAESMGEQLSRIVRKTCRPDQDLMSALPSNPTLDPTSLEPITKNTPITGPNFHKLVKREIHVYKNIGSIGGGTLLGAVDLATGQIWAVKECRPKKQQDADDAEKWKKPFKREVEILSALKHPNIVHLEHHQGWTKGAPVQIFLPLYQGSVRDLIPTSHPCEAPTAAKVPWLQRFVSHVLSGLSYLHDNGVLHCDIRPDNIMYDTGPDGLSFYISNFSSASSVETVGRGAGTTIYMAPETSRSGTTCLSSDLHSFGMSILEIIGMWCPNEARFTERQWQDKLKGYGVQGYAEYKDSWPGTGEVDVEEMQSLHSRIQSLIDYRVVPSCLADILSQDPNMRPCAREARHRILGGYNF